MGKKFEKGLDLIIGLLYVPVFLVAWLLHMVARIFLLIAYVGLLDRKKASITFKSFFKWYGRQ